MASKNNPAIDAALDRLAERTPAGRVLTAKEIADAAGCTVGYIRNVERFALAKIRREFERRIADGSFSLYGHSADTTFSLGATE